MPDVPPAAASATQCPNLNPTPELEPATATPDVAASSDPGVAACRPGAQRRRTSIQPLPRRFRPPLRLCPGRRHAIRRSALNGPGPRGLTAHRHPRLAGWLPRHDGTQQACSAVRLPWVSEDPEVTQIHPCLPPSLCSVGVRDSVQLNLSAVLTSPREAQHPP